MHRRIGAITVVIAIVALGLAGAAGATPLDAGSSGVDESHVANVTFDNQTSGGTTVTVSEAYLPEGGFLAIHDATLLDGGSAVFSSVRGSSSYLAAGTHENVTVTLSDPITEDATLIAMPHKDTDGDRTYTFVSSNGEQDGPYTADGNVVIDSASVTASATVTYTQSTTSGETAFVDRVEMANGGFIAMHDSSLLDGKTFDSVVGVSGYLGAGAHHGVRVTLDDPLESNDTLIAMPHRDTNDNQEYDFVTSEGEEDAPYVDAGGNIVLQPSPVEVVGDKAASVSFADQSSGGSLVYVESAFLPSGGFVTAHDSSLLDGATFDSVRGTSAYLGPGHHGHIPITLDEPLNESDTIIAMPHKDTNGNEAYDFVTSEGEEDAPYTDGDGNIVLDPGNVTVSAGVHIHDQESTGNSVTVASVDLSQGGFVTIHDASLLAGATFDSVRGTSAYLGPGLHEDVEVSLDDPLRTTADVFAMPHKDTNGNEQYDFVTSEGADDGPYTANGDIVLEGARITVQSQVTFEDQRLDTSMSQNTVTVQSATLHDGGFVTIHDGTLLDGAVFDSVRGSSEYLGPGTHKNVTIAVDGEFSSSTATLIAMPHYDTNDNEEYDFVTSEGGADGPYTAGGMAVVAPASVSIPGDASVTFNEQTTAGGSLTVAEVTMSQGGFVTIHDATLLDGATFDSVRGTSAYLEAGTHEDVQVSLMSPVTESGTFIAMPHKDTNANEEYDFVSSEGAEDAPYLTDSGDIVLQPAEVTLLQATVTFVGQETTGEELTVTEVTMSQGGFVTIHDATLLDGATFDSVRGTSAYLEAGTHQNVEVTLDDPVEESGTFIAMPHRDTNDNQEYDFVSSEGSADAPYLTAGGDIVLKSAMVELVDDSTPTETEMEETEMDTTEEEDTPTETGSPGFGIAVAVLALLGAALLARREQ